ncbi:hypothetical protein AcW2_000478 [Taiwanofungus camphoratus]|nr:hypothetical protein AcW2_000478 [Antrodia cinnamomea]
MKMDGWTDHLHFSFLGEHVLFPHLHLDSFRKFTIASLLAVFICATERLLTYAISKHWGPFTTQRSRFRRALWRACLYWLVTFDRLMYMLIAMTFNVGLIAITVTTLSGGQFIIEYLEAPDARPLEHENVREPLLSSRDYQAYEPASDSYPPPTGRPRSKSKPDSIFIHPNESNIARADAVAMQLGLSGDTDLVKGNVYRPGGESWELGKGRDVARELLGR